MKITYFGHACFLVEGQGGPRIVLDPFDASIGYPVPSVSADVVVASHEHFDHANLAAVDDTSLALVGHAALGRHEFRGATFEGVATRHYDDPAAAARGENTMAVIGLDGLRVCHAGDLGHALDADTASRLGDIDILMVPVGGFYTLPVGKVDAVVGLLEPRVVVPMHYRTSAVTSGGLLQIATVDEYLSGKERVRRKPATIEVTAADLPEEREIWVMAHTAEEG